MEYYLQNKEDYLEHYGIRGMKWGVRRYQNYDGSYTQAGLKRYNAASDQYNRLNDAYNSTKSKYKSGQATKLEVNQAKSNKKLARAELNRQYKNLKTDYKADQGKQLYAEGKTITNSYTPRIATAAAAVAVGAAAQSVSYMLHHNFTIGDVLKHPDIIGQGLQNGSLADKTAGIVAGLGTAAVSEVSRVYKENQATKLRAYYGHNSKSEKLKEIG